MIGEFAGLPLDSQILWLLPVALPLAAALAFCHPRYRIHTERWAPWTALPALLLAVAIPPDRSVEIPWLLLTLTFGLDEAGRVFLFFTAFLWLAAGIFARNYLAADQRRHRFLFYFLVVMSGNFGSILAQDVVGFYTFFALMSFSSYGLVVHPGNAEAFRAGRVYMVLVVVGEILLFAGMILGVSISASTDFHTFRHSLGVSPLGNVATGLLFVGLSVKVGALPLHLWLPLAHPAAPVPASAVLSGAIIKAGLIGWIRMLPWNTGLPLEGWSELCIAAGLAAAFYGAAVGLTQPNAKTVLAYSSISQMGLITVAFGLAFGTTDPAALVPVLVFAMHHGFAKGALFLGVGVASAGCRSSGQRWACAFGLVTAALWLAGGPLSSGGMAKGLLKSAATGAPGEWSAIIAGLLPWTSVATTLLLSRFLWLAWPRSSGHGNGSQRGMWLGWTAVLLAMLVCVPVWPWGDSIDVTKGLFAAEKAWPSVWPVLLGAAVAAAVALAAARGLPLPYWRIPAGDIVSLFDAAMRPGALRFREPDRSLTAPGPADPSPLSGYRRLLDAAGEAEENLARWTVFGAALLAILILSVGMLWLA